MFEEVESRSLITTAFVPLDGPWANTVSHGPVGDFDGDGLSDYLVIHNEGFVTGDPETRVRLYLGGKGGLQSDRFRELNDELNLHWLNQPESILDGEDVIQIKALAEGVVRIVLPTDTHPGRFKDPDASVDVVDLIWSEDSIGLSSVRDESLTDYTPTETDYDGNGFVDQFTVFSGGDFGVVHSLTPGDANADLFVDFQDFLVLANNFGKTDAIFAEGDFDEDGNVGFLDFLVLAENFGA